MQVKTFFIGLMMSVFSSTVWAAVSEEITFYPFSFEESMEGWYPDFAELPPESHHFFEIKAGWENLPQGQGVPEHKGLSLAFQNRSEELFSFYKHQLTQLEANTWYSIRFYVDMATNAPTGCVGFPQGPDAVYVKAGAIPYEPVSYYDPNAYFLQLNFDKGYFASQSGPDAVVLGNIANSSQDCFYPPYEMKSVVNTTEFIARTNEFGELWLFIGLDAVFGGKTDWYMDAVDIELTKISK